MSLELDFDLAFAALLWRQDTGTFWVTASGDLRRTRFDVAEAVENRLEPNRIRLNHYFYPGIVGEGLQRAGSTLLKGLEASKEALETARAGLSGSP